MCESAYGDQTEDAYSTIGRTYVLYAVSFVLGGQGEMFRRRNDNVELAFLVLVSMWGFQLRVGVIVTPRYLAESVGFKGVPWIE